MDFIYALVIICHAAFGGDCRVMASDKAFKTVTECSEYHIKTIKEVIQTPAGKVLILNADYINPVCHAFDKELTAEARDNELAFRMIEKYGPKDWKRPTKTVPMQLDGGTR